MIRFLPLFLWRLLINFIFGGLWYLRRSWSCFLEDFFDAFEGWYSVFYLVLYRIFWLIMLLIFSFTICKLFLINLLLLLDFLLWNFFLVLRLRLFLIRRNAHLVIVHHVVCLRFFAKIRWCWSFFLFSFFGLGWFFVRVLLIAHLFLEDFVQ